MWHLQPLLNPVAYVARHFGPGAVYGDPYDAIALVNKPRNGSALIHGTLSHLGNIPREQWRDLLLQIEQDCGVNRFVADRVGQRVEFLLQAGRVSLRPMPGPNQ